MQTQTLNYISASIGVRCTIGTSLSFSLGIQNRDGTPFDLAGYTLSAPIESPHVEGVAPLVASFSLSVDPVTSTITLSLDGGQTRQLGAAYIGTPIPWAWYLWGENVVGGTVLARGELLLFHA
jgi:hypothetical protein